VLSIFVDAAVNGRDLIVHGSGNRTQDFTYVTDVADAFWLAFERRASGAYNVSGGSPVTMARLAELAVASSPSRGSRIRVGESPDPQDDYRGVFSIDKARRDFGFEPRVSLEEGLTRCAALIAAPT
jgi:UDP-glucose 4-epimerase